MEEPHEVSGPQTRRLSGMPRLVVAGIEVPVALSIGARTLGLARLDLDEAGPGLLIPGCRSVHTFGMRFELDLYFLDRFDLVLRCCRAVPARRLLWCRGASAVLEVPGGESSSPGT